MASTPTTNLSYNKPAVGDRGWGTTMNANLDAIDTDLGTEHKDGGAHGPKVTISQTGDDNVLTVSQTTAATATVVNIINTGTGKGVNIQQDGEGNALVVDGNMTGNIDVLSVSNAGTGAACHLAPTANPTTAVLQVDHTTVGSGAGIQVLNSGTGDALFIDQDGNGIAFQIDNDGTGEGILVNQNGDGNGIEVVQTNSVATKSVLVVRNSGTGNAGFFRQDGDARAIIAAKLSTGSTSAMTLTNSGSGDALEINQTGNGIALNINSEATSANCIEIICSGSGDGLFVDHSGTGLAARFRAVSGASGPIIQLERDDTSLTNGDEFGEIQWVSLDTSHTQSDIAAQITVINNTTVQADNPNSSMFFTPSEGADGLSVVMTVRHPDSGVFGTGIGQVGIGTTAPSDSAHVEITSTATSGTELLIDHNGTGSGDVVQILSAGSGKYIDTDAGGGTPAHLTNGGVWTDASCFKALKEEIEPVDVISTLENVERMEISRYYDKADKSSDRRRRFAPFQDDLVELFGLSDKGVSAVEVASIALAAIKALKQEVDELKAKLGE